jgi:hypothetical protein
VIPARLFWAYFTDVAFVAAAISIANKRILGMAAMLLGTMFFLWVVLLHIPRVTGAIRNGNEVTSLFVAVAMCGLSLVLAGLYGRSLERRDAVDSVAGVRREKSLRRWLAAETLLDRPL